MSKSITQKMKYKQSVIKYSYKHGVKKASIQFNEWPKTIYRWRKRYDGNIESLRDKSRRPHYHPNQHTDKEIKMIKDYKRNNKETGLVVLWVKLRAAGYTRTIQGLYHVLQRLGIYKKTPRKAKEEKIEKVEVKYPGEKVQIDVKYVPTVCMTKELQEKGERFYYKKVFYSLEDLRNRGKEWRKEYNNFPMRPLGWMSPNEYLKKYKSQEESLSTI